MNYLKLIIIITAVIIQSCQISQNTNENIEIPQKKITKIIKNNEDLTDYCMFPDTIGKYGILKFRNIYQYVKNEDYNPYISTSRKQYKMDLCYLETEIPQNLEAQNKINNDINEQLIKYGIITSKIECSTHPGSFATRTVKTFEIDNIIGIKMDLLRFPKSSEFLHFCFDLESGNKVQFKNMFSKIYHKEIMTLVKDKLEKNNMSCVVTKFNPNINTDFQFKLKREKIELSIILPNFTMCNDKKNTIFINYDEIKNYLTDEFKFIIR